MAAAAAATPTDEDHREWTAVSSLFEILITRDFELKSSREWQSPPYMDAKDCHVSPYR